MWAYALIATGFINWNYQQDQQETATMSLLVIIPGLLLIGLTFIKGAHGWLAKKSAQYLWGVVGVVALVIAFVN
jgi:hypothetical protein